MGDVCPPEVADADDAGADEEHDRDHVPDPAVRDHVADLVSSIPLRVCHLVPIDIGLWRHRRLDPDEERNEALGPAPGRNLAADIVGKAPGGYDIFYLHLPDLLAEFGEHFVDHFLRVLHADVAGGQLHAVGVNGAPLGDEVDHLLTTVVGGDDHERCGVTRLLVEPPGELLPGVLVLYESAGFAATCQLVLGGRLRPALGGDSGDQNRAEVCDLPALWAKLRPSGHFMSALLRGHVGHLLIRSRRSCFPPLAGCYSHTTSEH